jgi:hypothetical protein
MAAPSSEGGRHGVSPEIIMRLSFIRKSSPEKHRPVSQVERVLSIAALSNASDD